MKAISSNVTRGVESGSFLKCADNTGAQIVQLITVKSTHSVRRRRTGAGVGAVIVGAVKKGDVKIRHEVVTGVIVRQRKEFRRPNGMRVKFEDNAVVLVNERMEPRGTEIKGPIAKEVVERFSALGKIASTIV